MSEDYLAQVQVLAIWNSARGVWERTIQNIICEHWEPYSEPLPTSGMMHNGKLYPRPTLEQHTDGKESLLLRTPIASEADGGAIHPEDAKANGNTLKLGWQVLALGGHIEPKLPTPTAQNIDPKETADEWLEKARRYDERGKSTPTVSLETAILVGDDKSGLTKRLRETELLPTPLTTEYKQSNSPGSLNRHSPPLGSLAFVETWGKFGPAIERWEKVMGRPAPPPTEPDGRNGKHRLNPLFVEWLMGLGPLWVTGADITRNEMLKACGNGVVPQQASLALKILGAEKYVIQDN